MLGLHPHALGIAAALGIGLLIGVERERKRLREATGGPAGVRTFALAALLGAVGQIAAGTTGLLLAIAVAAAFAYAAYQRSAPDDTGLTTEVALVLTCALGGLAQTRIVTAAACGALVALLLVSRSWMHRWVSERLSDQELTDAVLLAAAALVVLPLLPDRPIDPFGVLNPRLVWTLAVTVMLINAAGYVALRTLGAARALAVAGLAGGFVSSVATIASMGSHARQGAPGAVAGAALSSIATVVQLAIVVGIANPPLLASLWPALIGAGVVAIVYGGAFSWHALRGDRDVAANAGRAFQPRTALLFALTVSAVLFVSAALTEFFGARGGLVGVAVAGFADAHSSAVSAASLARTGGLSDDLALLAILIAFTTNTITKAVVACVSGGVRFAVGILPGLALMLVAAWIGLWIAAR